MADLEFSDIWQMHTDKFGVEPVVTGINFAKSDELIDNLIDAINTGTPYVEEKLPEGAVT